jgi:hypothetical protein
MVRPSSCLAACSSDATDASVFLPAAACRAQSVNLATSTTNLIDMTFSYDGPSQTITLSASSGNYMFLIDTLKERLQPAFGIKLPATSTPARDVSTISTTAVVDFERGLRSLSIGLGGSITVAALAARLGFSWPLPADAITISRPVVRYTVQPMALEAALLVDVPALGIRQAAAALKLGSGSQVSVQVS